MKITTARELQAMFQGGLQITGEDEEGELMWIGTDEQWNKAKRLLTLYQTNV